MQLWCNICDMILALRTRGDLLRWCALLLYEHIARYPLLWSPEHSRCSGSLYFPILSVAATCRCAGNSVSECDVCFTLQFLCALVKITWVVWKFLCLNHRWQHYRQDFFFLGCYSCLKQECCLYPLKWIKFSIVRL